VKGIGLVLAALLLVLGLGVGGHAAWQGPRSDPNDPLRVAEEFGWYPGSGRPAYRWSPEVLASAGTALALARDSDHKPCVLYDGAGYGGGVCFKSGWAVEVKTVPTVSGDAYVGAVITQVAAVRFGTKLTVPVLDVPGRGRFVAVYDDAHLLSAVNPNDIVAIDANGRLLGRQHYNDGRGGFGAMDGSFDRRWARKG
jgi:hypothetical protein